MTRSLQTSRGAQLMQRPLKREGAEKTSAPSSQDPRDYFVTAAAGAATSVFFAVCLCDVCFFVEVFAGTDVLATVPSVTTDGVCAKVTADTAVSMAATSRALVLIMVSSDSSEIRLGSDSPERAQHLLGLRQQRRVYPNGLREGK